MTTEIYHKICHYLRRLISGTEWEGHVFTVGGCCRDRQLGLEIKDVDLAVDLPMGGVKFANWLWKKHLTCFHPVEFKRYGTAMTRLKAFPHDDIEIVQTRAEKYTDHNSRNPETAFGSLKDDCFRRDLTINSLYYDISRDKTIDITGRAIHDIRHKIIDTPSDPDSTYDDDPVRILRTLRFATRLDWEIPARIMEAMQRNASRMEIVKIERLRNEFEKMLQGPRPGRAMELMRRTGALEQIIPELQDLYNLPLSDEPGTVWEHTLRTLNAIREPDLALRMAALLHDIGKPASLSQDAEGNPRYPRHEMRVQAPVVKILSRMKYHSPFMKEVVFLCRHHTVARTWGSEGEKISDKALRHLQYNSASPSRLRALMTLIDAINKAHTRLLAKPLQAEAILRRDEEMRNLGTDMYDYHLPFGERRIKKLKQIGAGPQVADCISFMMRMACDDPTLSHAEFERRLLAYQPKEYARKRATGNYPTAVQPIPEALQPLPGHRKGAYKEFGIPDPDKKQQAKDNAKSRKNRHSNNNVPAAEAPKQDKHRSRRRRSRKSRRTPVQKPVKKD